MRALFVAAMLSSLAYADTSTAPLRPRPSGTFDAFVRALALRRAQHVVASWLVDLDGDGAPEHVAVLYDDDLSYGDFIIEKRPRRRWDVRFYADGRTLPHDGGNPPPPDDAPVDGPFRGPHARRPNTILYRMGHRGGYADALLALRNGRVAVVYEEELDDARAGDRPVATDYDALVRRGQADYRYILPATRPNEDELALRSLD